MDLKKLSDQGLHYYYFKTMFYKPHAVVQWTRRSSAENFHPDLKKLSYQGLHYYYFITMFHKSKEEGIISYHIINGFLINVQVQGHHPHQWAPFQVTG